MPILTGNNKTEKKPTMTANSISPAMHDQIQSIIESGKDNQTVTKHTDKPKEAKGQKARCLQAENKHEYP